MELNETASDFKLKYSECVGYLTEENGDSDLFLVDFWDGGNGLTGYVRKNDNWTPVARNVSRIKSLDFPMPDLGLVNSGTFLVDVTRNPRRQYKRGFTTSNGVISSKVIEEGLSYQLHKDKMFTLGADFIYDVFNPIYYSPEMALESITNKERVAAAINNRYYFSMSNRLPYIYLGFGQGNVIGRVNENNAKVQLFKSAQPLYEDLSNFVDIRRV